MKKENKIYAVLAGIAALIILLAVAEPFYVVEEGTQAVVTRFGEVVGSRTKAGLYVKAPFIDSVTEYPRRILSLDGDSARIPTKENQFIVVDTTSRWRIEDPELFYAAFKTLDAAYAKLSDVIDSSTRTIITRNRLSEIVRSSNIINESSDQQAEIAVVEGEDSAEIESLVNVDYENENVVKGRKALCEEMAEEARKMVGEYGIELIDIVPRQIKYSDELTNSVYNRMIKERNQAAQAYRSIGESRKTRLLGKLENEKRTIESEAYRISEETKGKADAEAAAIYTEAYSKDQRFYEFWKSLESYKKTMGKFDSAYSTDMDYFKYLYNSEGR
ncbi:MULTISPECIES: protease modulator HflC [Treponema]|uniref:Protein HflC n=1 Tax=Treponema rectale TaxID=744512 RepID=A0A840SBV5_9SPIR|nr:MULTISPECIES: protease modulator HflC [Treponema]MBB5219247.1 membrane protease subunit HflC [Treponema rectale]MBE6354822.1 protease modulator HflC [Treponema sp.]MBO6177006.1 protease modulator HflC [Treponema sp.]QOS40867.1 protease modulator HflC [Treponema rectale]